jgi:enoyl-CoA hydratase/carnithine racemase
VSSTHFETIVYEKSGPVARLTMNRPDRLNGMTNRMLVETRDALAVAAEDRGLRVLVLTGAGKGFCPGADISKVASAAPDAPLTHSHDHDQPTRGDERLSRRDREGNGRSLQGCGP